MPKTAHKNRKINLLLKEGFEYSTVGRILTWGLSVGRIIVVATELVVIVAFLSRFWLDRTLTDLNEANSAKRRQIEASAKFESDFRAAQDRLSSFKKVSTKTNDGARVQKIASLLPADVKLNRITLSKKDFLITGTALSESGLAGVLKGLADSGEFQNVALSNLSLATEGQQGLVFSVKGDIKNGN